MIHGWSGWRKVGVHSLMDAPAPVTLGRGNRVEFGCRSDLGRPEGIFRLLGGDGLAIDCES